MLSISRALALRSRPPAVSAAVLKSAAAGLGLALLSAFAMPAAAHEYKAGELTIQHPWSRATPAGAQVAAGYMAIHNAGSEPDRLLSVTSDISGKAEIHQMSVDDKGVMTMRPVDGGLEIPSGADVVLKPGSYHLMFVNLRQPPREGERFPATLHFEKTGDVSVEFAVEKMSGGMDHDDMGTMKMDGGDGSGAMGTMKSGG